MRRLPPLAAVRAFEAAARHESFTAAAAELGLTQAAVSYQVKALEERLGSALFVRERGRVRLTALGQRLLVPLTQAFDSIETAFASHQAEDESLLVVTTTQTFASTWLAWRLGNFQIAHPDLAVRLTASNSLVDLRGGQADVAIRAGTGGWPDLECHLLMSIDFTPMASPRFVQRVESELGRPIEPADVPDLPMISPDDEWWDVWFREAQVDGGGRRRGRGLRLDSQAAEGSAAMGGQGFVLLTPAFWQQDIADGRLAMPFPNLVSSRGYAYWLVYPPERKRVPKVKRFREWLLGEMQKQCGNGKAAAAPALGRYG